MEELKERGTYAEYREGEGPEEYHTKVKPKPCSHKNWTVLYDVKAKVSKSPRQGRPVGAYFSCCLDCNRRTKYYVYRTRAAVNGWNKRNYKFKGPLKLKPKKDKAQ